MNNSFLVEKKNLLKLAGVLPRSLTYMASGANGNIYKSQNKIFKFSHSNTGAIRDAKKEYNTIQKVYRLGAQTPFVPKVHGFYSTPGKGSLTVMNLVKGKTLRNISSNLNKKNEGDIKRQLLAIVERLRAMRIIHGDLHDNNIIIEKLRNGAFKITIIDFGRSRNSRINVNNVFEHNWSTQLACVRKPGSRTCKLPYGYHKGSELPTGISNELFVESLFNKNYKLPFEIEPELSEKPSIRAGLNSVRRGINNLIAMQKKKAENVTKLYKIFTNKLNKGVLLRKNINSLNNNTKFKLASYASQITNNYSYNLQRALDNTNKYFNPQPQTPTPRMSPKKEPKVLTGLDVMGPINWITGKLITPKNTEKWREEAMKRAASKRKLPPLRSPPMVPTPIKSPPKRQKIETPFNKNANNRKWAELLGSRHVR